MGFRHGWRLTLITSGIVWALSSHAAGLCGRTEAELLRALEAPENRIAFRNHGGLLNGGVCWWHSRLQRSSLYLAEFSPSLPRPTREDAERIVEHLVRMDSTVVIPGYRNFAEFTLDYRTLIQEKLDAWQVRDGFLHQQWIRGLWGRPQMGANGLRERMRKIFGRFRKSKPGLWVMAQYPGVTSHALLLIGMKPTETGFRMRAIDSNLPGGIREFEYRLGDRSLNLSGEPFTPYAGFQSDFRKIEGALERHCSR